MMMPNPSGRKALGFRWPRLPERVKRLCDRRRLVTAVPSTAEVATDVLEVTRKAMFEAGEANLRYFRPFEYLDKRGRTKPMRQHGRQTRLCAYSRGSTGLVWRRRRTLPQDSFANTLSVLTYFPGDGVTRASNSGRFVAFRIGWEQR
jgi:hypothetical protein